ncbi:MAG TPA: PASTA domain-containing protein, partial [Actinomycetota bacterium]|nr:PASTA domain-containing protein [Actinomycetota bacterium]
YKHVKEDPIPPSRLNADIPPAIEAIVMKALAKNPDNRYQNAQEMRQDLMRAAAGKPVHATPLMPPIEQTSIHQPAVSDQTTIIRRTGPTPMDTRRRRRTGWILMTLILLAIAGVVTWAILSTLNGPKPLVAIPDVVDKPLAEARDLLTDQGFRPEVDGFQAHPTIPEGNVVSQDPAPPTRIEEGSTVRLIVSSGPGSVTFPDVEGKTLAEAEKLITDAGLVVGTVSRRYHATIAKDLVIDQEPEGGFRGTAGQKVNLQVSRGPEIVPVPTVIGMSEADARAELTQAGFLVNVVRSSEGTCAFAPGEVCDQDPDGGDPLEKGKTVTITVGESGFPTDEPTPTPTES